MKYWELFKHNFREIHEGRKSGRFEYDTYCNVAFAMLWNFKGSVGRVSPRHQAALNRFEYRCNLRDSVNNN